MWQILLDPEVGKHIKALNTLSKKIVLNLTTFKLRNSSFCDDESFLKTYGEQTMGYLGIYLEDKNQKELALNIKQILKNK